MVESRIDLLYFFVCTLNVVPKYWYFNNNKIDPTLYCKKVYPTHFSSVPTPLAINNELSKSSIPTLFLSKRCGRGRKNRNVTCSDKDRRSCDRKSKPPSRITCRVVCPKWKTSEWSKVRNTSSEMFIRLAQLTYNFRYKNLTSCYRVVALTNW